MLSQFYIFLGRIFANGLERRGLSIIGTSELEALKRDLKTATRGRCTCSDCGREVNNAWRDSDGHHCLTCLAKQRDNLREFARNVRDDFDCDSDAHKYGTYCRCCEAAKVIGQKT